ncbi:MAG TPA: hypothetical protein VIC62_13250 [Nakamurella sp.]
MALDDSAGFGFGPRGVDEMRRRRSGIDRRMSACCAKAVVAAPLRPGVGRRLPVR